MKESFITKIQINKSRNLTDFAIPLSQNSRKHLILTGKNGSGKTTLLTDLHTTLDEIKRGFYELFLRDIKKFEEFEKRKLEIMRLPEKFREDQTQMLEKNIESHKKELKERKNEIYFSNPNTISNEARKGNFVIVFFGAKRQTNLNIPSGINKLKLKKDFNAKETASPNFIQYIVNLKADRSFARDEDEFEVVEKIDKWFERFENRLRELFDSPDLQLKFDRKNYNFEIIEGNKLPSNFNTLSDGYSAILNIVTELVMRMEAHESKFYDLEGVVLIDEIETHLHVDLQKKVLPFLIDFFPKIQFIVTTHSPFVLSSISNAVVCDLEKRIVTTDLSGYSYDTLIESYFESDKYSSLLKEYIYKYENLLDKENLSESEKSELYRLKLYFNEIPKFISNELAVKLQQIELKNLGSKKKI